jgi:SAM-dependent methyltransferase
MYTDSSKGAQVYTPLSLRFYDWWVLNLSNRYAWRCKTEPVLLDHFQKYMGDRHLDIGVGTGYYLAKSLHKTRHITLLDLNPNSLKAAENRIGSDRIAECIKHDVFIPLPKRLEGYYNSVSMFYLLHCLPGDMVAKSPIIGNVASTLKASGTLYGATILGKGVEHNAFGRKLISVYNKKGIFCNNLDALDTLHAALSVHFKQVNVKLQGAVALFAAKQKM